MPDDRSVAATVAMIARLALLPVALGLTVYYGSKPELRGRLVIMVFALAHFMLFLADYTTCLYTSKFCFNEDIYRYWSAGTNIHYLLAWGVVLRDLVTLLKEQGARIRDLLKQIDELKKALAQVLDAGGT